MVAMTRNAVRTISFHNLDLVIKVRADVLLQNYVTEQYHRTSLLTEQYNRNQC